MTSTIDWATGDAAGFVGLSSAVVALPADHWEALGATFVLDESDADWPQRIAIGGVATAIASQRFAILDEGDVTTLLIEGDDERRTMHGVAVLVALAEQGLVDLDRDVLQIGIGDAPGAGTATATITRLANEVAALRVQVRLLSVALGGEPGLAARARAALEQAEGTMTRMHDTRHAADDPGNVSVSGQEFLERLPDMSLIERDAGTFLDALQDMALIERDPLETVQDAPVVQRDRLDKAHDEHDASGEPQAAPAGDDRADEQSTVAPAKRLRR